MVEIITQTGTVEKDRVIVKASGWVKTYNKEGTETVDVTHYPPHRVKQIKGDENVTHTSPHGRV